MTPKQQKQEQELVKSILLRAGYDEVLAESLSSNQNAYRWEANKTILMIAK